jgi:hypothetical protein
MDERRASLECSCVNFGQNRQEFDLPEPTLATQDVGLRRGRLLQG